MSIQRTLRALKNNFADKFKQQKANKFSEQNFAHGFIAVGFSVIIKAKIK